MIDSLPCVVIILGLLKCLSNKTIVPITEVPVIAGLAEDII
jgi:hypothetical protein